MDEQEDSVTPPPRDRRALEAHLTKRTKITVEVKAMIAMACAVAIGGFGAGVQLTRLVLRMEQVEQRVVETATKTDLAIMRGEIKRAVSRGLRRMIVTCPLARRGETEVRCTAALPEDPAE